MGDGIYDTQPRGSLLGPDGSRFRLRPSLVPLLAPSRLQLDPALLLALGTAAPAAAAAPASEPRIGESTVPGPGSGLLFPSAPAAKPDPANLWLASVYQGIGLFNHPGSTELELNAGGLLAFNGGLGVMPSVGGGLNELSFALRRAAFGSPRNMSFDVGAAGAFSYLSSGGFGPRRFPNAATLAGTAHYAWQADNDWGLGIYGNFGLGWMRAPTTNDWLGPTYGGTLTFVGGREPDEGVKLGWNLAGSLQNLGGLTQGPTLANLASLLGVFGISGDLGPVGLSGEVYGGVSGGGGTTAGGGTGQSGLAWNAGAGIGLSITRLGPLTPLDYGTPRNQTNTISFNLNYYHQQGRISGVDMPMMHAGPFDTNSLLFTLTFGYRRPPDAD